MHIVEKCTDPAPTRERDKKERARSVIAWHMADMTSVSFSTYREREREINIIA